MVAVYVLGGINHFWRPAMYLRIMPPYLPWHLELVYLSGLAEIALGLLLLPMATRRYAAWGIIVLLIVIFPANVHMAVVYWRLHSPLLWIALLRLPLQWVLISWAYKYTRVPRTKV